MGKMRFAYDGTHIAELVLHMYAERVIEPNSTGISYAPTFTKAHRYAAYEWLRKADGDRIDAILHTYVKKHGIQEITFADWQAEAALIFDCIYEERDFKDLLFNFQIEGAEGCGVGDLRDKTFYGCQYAQHWATIQRVLEEKYPEQHRAAMFFFYNHQRDEFEGVTRGEIDKFLLMNFRLVGETQSLGQYIGGRKR